MLLAPLILQLLTIKALMLFTTLPIESLPIGLLPLLVVAMNQGRITAVGVAMAGVLISGLAVGRSWDLTVAWLMVGLTAVAVGPKDRLSSAGAAGRRADRARVRDLPAAGRRGLAGAVAPAAAAGRGRPRVARGRRGHPAAVRSAGAMAAGLTSAALAPCCSSPSCAPAATSARPCTLRRFSDLDQPLLKRLFAEAPGTYQHSMNVAYLAQAAGNAIDANPLLLRIGAYFHDIGKARPPRAGSSRTRSAATTCTTASTPTRASRSSTATSCRACGWPARPGCPPVVIDLIEQHHGTQSVRVLPPEGRQARRPAKPSASRISATPAPSPARSRPRC
ncbi:MAG: HDIG domain-containing protein [Desulfobacterales bacterium]|nr:HDIG domain-containing protein [Desulfobacterales bacterium]